MNFFRISHKLYEIRLNNFLIKLDSYVRLKTKKKMINLLNNISEEQLYRELESGRIVDNLIREFRCFKNRTATKEILSLLISVFYAKKYSNDTLLFSSEQKIHSYVSNNFLSKISEKELDILFTVFGTISGRFKIIYQLRDIRLNKILSMENLRKKSVLEYFMLFKAYVELNQFHKAENLLKVIKKSFRRYLLPLKKMNGFTELILNSKNSNYKLSKLITSKEVLFLDAVRDKKVAIIGPVKSNKEILNKILEEYDVVIVTNYFINEIDKVEEKNLFKINTLYSRYLKQESELIFHKLPQLKFIIRSNNINFNKKRFRSFVNRKIKVYNYFISGTQNFIQRITIDILHFGPKTIKIFNTNFFYNSSTSPTNQATWGVVIWHDQISQIRLIRNLYNKSLIELDSEAETIIKMDESIYLNHIQNNYS